MNKNEIKEAIFQMENQKSPGIDGTPIEFYKENYDPLEDDLYQLYTNTNFFKKKNHLPL